MPPRNGQVADAGMDTEGQFGESHDHEVAHVLMLLAGVAGVVSYSAAVWALRSVQFNIVSYQTAPDDAGDYLPADGFALALVILLAVLAVTGVSGRGVRRWTGAAAALWPLVLTLPITLIHLWGYSISFIWGLVFILVVGVTALRIGTGVSDRVISSKAGIAAFASLLLLVAASITVHARLQMNFFEHLMLGHADVGHYAEELYNFLHGRGLQANSVGCHRFGLHFVPLIYVLVPGYALWPSPIYLMVCGPLFAHLPALLIYWFARKRSGSILMGWLFAVAWLLLPSVSRVVYANTYGFQWNLFAMPLMVMMIGAWVSGWRGWSLVFAGLVLLCKETTAPAVFGWGVYLALCTRSRKTGLAVMVFSIAYLYVVLRLVIPAFSGTERFGRLDLYGEIGASLIDLLKAPIDHPDVVLSRLARREAWHYPFVLLCTMGLLPLRGWRMALAACPTVSAILLLADAQWLNIKFWHQSPILPLLFCAGCFAADRRRTDLLDGVVRFASGMRQGRARSSETNTKRCKERLFRGRGKISDLVLRWKKRPRGLKARGSTVRGPEPHSANARDFFHPETIWNTAAAASETKSSNEASARAGVRDDEHSRPSDGRIARSSSRVDLGWALCALSAAWASHYLFAFSPLSKPYAVYAADETLHQPDPRFAAIQWLRGRIPRSATIQATERVAAHFTDYEKLFTGVGPRGADFVIIDRGDTWDATELPRSENLFRQDPDYEPYGEFGPMIVFRRVGNSGEALRTGPIED